MPKEFDINILMALCEEQRYATTVAGFEAIDMSDQIDVPKKLQKAKPAIRAMSVLSLELVKWSYIGEEERQALREELGLDISQELEGAPTEAKPSAVALVESEKKGAKTEEAKPKTQGTESKEASK